MRLKFFIIEYWKKILQSELYINYTSIKLFESVMLHMLAGRQSRERASPLGPHVTDPAVGLELHPQAADPSTCAVWSGPCAVVKGSSLHKDLEHPTPC